MPVAPPPTTIDHQLTHWDENMSPDIVAVNVALIVLATIAVLSRLISRRIKAAPLQADDFMVMVSLVSRRRTQTMSGYANIGRVCDIYTCY